MMNKCPKKVPKVPVWNLREFHQEFSPKLSEIGSRNMGLHIPSTERRV